MSKNQTLAYLKFVKNKEAMRMSSEVGKATIALVILFLMQACSPNFYVPNNQNLPGFTEKGQTKVNAVFLLNLERKVKGGDVQLAHSLTNRSAILFNTCLYYGHNEKSTFNGFPFKSNQYDLGGRGHALEAGYGFYKEVKAGFIAEVYGMEALGGFKNNVHASDSNGSFGGKFNRISIQSGFTYKSKHFETVVSSRFNYLHYFNIRGQFDQYDKLLKDTPDNFFFEPGITFRVGFNKVKLQLQYQYSLLLNNNDFYIDNPEINYPFTTINLTVGLKLDL